MHRLLMGTVLAISGIGEETPGGKAFNHRRVVLVGGQHASTVVFVGVLDHGKQRFLLCLTINIPAGIENLVATVLGVGLGEHHQLDVMGIAAKLAKAVY